MRISAILIAILISMSGFMTAQATTHKKSSTHAGRSRGHKKSSSHRSHTAKTKSGNVT